MLYLADGPGALRRFILPAIFVIALFAAQFLRSGVDEVAEALTHRFVGPTMGTQYTVKVVASDLTATQQSGIAQAIVAQLEAVNAEMSTYRPDSALSKINASQSTEAVSISSSLITVLTEAQRIHRESEGAFDVTVGPLVNLWGFGPDGRQDPPSEAAVVALKPRIGQALLHLDAAARTLRKGHSALYIDLSAIAKGYAVDRVARAIDELGHGNYYVDVGGELRVKGKNADDIPWRVGIERPDGGRGAVQEVLHLTGMSVATSGDYRNYYERNGVRVSHTIDPRHGRPIHHALASVTVLHSDCMTADAWATALNVLGPEAGLALARKKGLPALFVIRGPEGQFSVRRTPSLEGHTRPAIPSAE
jgi:thiamine biosynthesis lipoprotein